MKNMPIVQFNKQLLPDGFSTTNGFFRIIHNDKNVALINMTCPHRGGPLTHAEEEKDYLICPWHKKKCKKIKLVENFLPVITIDDSIYFVIETEIKAIFNKLPSQAK